jgi:hypothetical protein
MDKRAWLVSQGLAQGTRGRFSREAEDAWTKHLIETSSGNVAVIDGPTPIVDLPRDGFHLATVPVEYPIVRKEDSAYTIDEQGTMIGHTSCGDCKRQVNQCVCKGGPTGLSFIKPRQKAYLFVKGS